MGLVRVFILINSYQSAFFFPTSPPAVRPAGHLLPTSPQPVRPARRAFRGPISTSPQIVGIFTKESHAHGDN